MKTMRWVARNTYRLGTSPLVLMLLLAAALAAGLLALVGTIKPAKAAFPGSNGKIAFASSRTTGAGVDNPEGDSEIFTMNPDRTGIEQLTFNDTNDFDLAWSAQGNAIAFTSNRDDPNHEIYVMDAAPESATNQPVRLTNNAATDDNPTFSPDGSKIAFKSNRAPQGVDIFVMDAKDEINNVTGDPGPDGNGDNLRRLTTNFVFDGEPAWSPDGSNKIAFTSTRDDNFGEIYVMDAVDINPADGNGDNLKRLTNNAGGDSGPNWSPDGSKIAFTRDANPDLSVTNNDIFVMDAKDEINNVTGDPGPDGNGDNLKRLTKKAAFDCCPAWSPDGKKIAFRSDRGGGDTDVYVMKAKPESTKNRPKNLTKNGVPDFDPDWQPIPPP